MKTVARWVLLGALVLGVIVMHHLGSAGSGHPMTALSAMSISDSAVTTDSAVMTGAALTADTALAAGTAPMTGGQHDMFHLCLAVLSFLAFLALALFLLFVRRVTPAVRAGLPPGLAPARGPPPRPGRELLLAVCVLRQ